MSELKGTTIPDIRARIFEMAGEIEAVAPAAAKELRHLMFLSKRRKPIRQAKAKRRGPDIFEAAEIRQFAFDHPDMAENDIGARFGFNQGRVSEVLHGIRK